MPSIRRVFGTIRQGKKEEEIVFGAIKCGKKEQFGTIKYGKKTILAQENKERKKRKKITKAYIGFPRSGKFLLGLQKCSRFKQHL